MMKAGVIITIIILVLVIGGIVIFTTSSSKTSGSAVSGQTVLDNPNPGSDTEVNPGSSANPAGGEIKTFAISGRNYRFVMNGQENPDIIVNEGDRVRIIFMSDEGFHDWRVDEFQASTQKISQGQSSTTEFTATRKGTFEYYCSVGEHRANGMKGKLIVQ